MYRGSFFVTHNAADEDGNLKIKRLKDFTDSKAELEFNQATAEEK